MYGENALVVYCTVPDAAVGKDIAKTLVQEGLCACINQIPSVTSYYIYDGKFCEDSEELLVIKSHASHFDQLKNRIIELHPYEVPEIIASEITVGSKAYLQWLANVLKPL